MSERADIDFENAGLLPVVVQDAGGNAYKSCFYRLIKQTGSGGLELKLKE